MGIASKLSPDLQAKSSDNGIIVDPNHVQINQLYRARHFALDPTHIQDLAQSMAMEGQHQAVQTRKIEDGNIELVFGEHRHAAAILINKDDKLKELAAEYKNIHPKTGKFMLKVSVISVSDEDAFVSALTENRRQKSPSIIDDAHNQQKLRDNFGWNDEQIAKYYDHGVPWIQRTKKLLELNEAEKKMVHEGSISVMDAMNLSSLNEQDRNKIIESATTEDGRIDKQKLNAETRSAKNKKKRTLSRNLSQIRKDIKNTVENKETDEATKEFLNTFMHYIKGKIGMKDIETALEVYAKSHSQYKDEEDIAEADIAEEDLERDEYQYPDESQEQDEWQEQDELNEEMEFSNIDDEEFEN